MACLFYQSQTERLARTVFGFLPWKNWPAQVIRTIASYRHDLGTVAAALGISVLANSLLLIVMLLAVYVLNPAGLDLKMCLIIPVGFHRELLALHAGRVGCRRDGIQIAVCRRRAERWRRSATVLASLDGPGALARASFLPAGIEHVFGHPRPQREPRGPRRSTVVAPSCSAICLIQHSRHGTNPGNGTCRPSSPRGKRYNQMD